jgi:signal transduction histidine kinase
MKANFLTRHLTAGLTLGAGVTVSLAAALWVGQWEQWNQQARFQRQIENLSTALQRSFDSYTNILKALGDFYAVTDGVVDRATFRGLVQRSLTTSPGIQALEWADFVPQPERLGFEQRIRGEGFPQFQIMELGPQGLRTAGDRSYYIPVTFVEPLTGNEAALGFDLASDEIRRSALERARDTGAVSTTGRIRLVQEQRDQFGFLVFLPVYDSPQPLPLVRERRDRLRGYLLGVFRVSDVVEESLQNLSADIDFWLRDQNAPPTEQFLGAYQSATKRITTTPSPSAPSPQNRAICPTEADCTRQLNVGDRQWSVTFTPAATYPNTLPYGSLATLLIGLLLTSGLALFLASLRRKLERTRELSDLKLRFFSMASHELRTPLSTILLSSQSLSANDNFLSDEQKQKNVQRIQSAAKRMTQMISDLLTLNRAEVGKLEFAPEWFDLESFCRQLVEELQADRPQLIWFVFSGERQVYLDQKLMRSLLTNLLSNACKYSPDTEPVQFQVTCHETAATLVVRDRGIGIPPEDLPRLQEAFYRASNVGERSGTGLGLAVVKTCVELHRGEIAIASQVDQGTTVTVTLPLLAAPVDKPLLDQQEHRVEAVAQNPSDQD